MIREFRSHGKAWKFFQAQAPSYKQKVTHWITSAKQEATRERRLRKLIEACENRDKRISELEERLSSLTKE